MISRLSERERRRRRVVVGLENDDSFWREAAELDKEGTIKVMREPVSQGSAQKQLARVAISAVDYFWASC
jgi:hypothetical protein